MKVSGLKMTYYMKNGVELTDTSYVFPAPVEENNTELVYLLDKIKKYIETSMKHGVEGSLVSGNLYVRISELNAVRVELIKFRREDDRDEVQK